MSNNKDKGWFQDNIDQIQAEVNKHLISWERTNYKKESFKIMIIYLVLGGLWIALSDKILGVMVGDQELYQLAQLYKGWFYVFVTTIVFYFVISNRMKSFYDMGKQLYITYEELAASHEELLAMESALSEQYKELKKSKNKLALSNERYKMLVEAANDGIWNWDLRNNYYFFSIAYRENFGYKLGDLEENIYQWRKLTHPDDNERINYLINQHLERKAGVLSITYRIRTKYGDYRWITSRGKFTWDEKGVPIHAVGSHTDITEQKNMEKRLYQLAYYDQLTGLPNGAYLKEEAEKLIENTKQKDESLALLYIDIDNFRNINDTLGHEVGDEFLIHTAKRLSAIFKPPNLVVRFGGDRFGALVLNANRDNLIGKIEAFKKEISKPWVNREQHFFISASVGVALWPNHGDTYSSLFQSADIALSHIKDKGKDGYSIFTQDMKEKPWQFIEMDNQLRTAIENDEFQIYYQPIFHITGNKVIGAEALIRWFHPTKGYIAPMDFIPFAEENGYIQPISKRVFKAVCKQKRKWVEKGYKPLKVSVNMSRKIFSASGFINRTREIMEANFIEKFGIELEITETALMDNFDKSVKLLGELKNLGLTIALDDFGTGHSSLTYLTNLPIDVIKIDKKFIAGINNSEKESNILKYIIKLAHALGLKVIAEGVEREDQLKFLKDNNCDMAQGFYLARPMPASDLEKYLENTSL